MVDLGNYDGFQGILRIKTDILRYMGWISDDLLAASREICVYKGISVVYED